MFCSKKFKYWFMLYILFILEWWILENKTIKRDLCVSYKDHCNMLANNIVINARI